ncbi:hypothetical protein GP486_006867 [Trichoglossum hirsutum]|uniref:Uncharacterized protein n=1 Tax=Trichoglossum hirsutum TaxID=265104 RepID=A0A9P8ICT4_9PEZI|nr:hypothetical protein GP486_006867 [Trichoglossum hirsutum]
MATPKLNDIIAGVIDKEHRQRGKESSTALAVKVRGKGKGDKTKHCTHCNRDGHNNLECWKLHPEKKPEKKEKKKSKDNDSKDSKKSKDKSKKSDQKEIIGMTAHTTKGDQSNSAWIFDSGVSHYMCNNRNLFTRFSSLNQIATIANNSTMAI